MTFAPRSWPSSPGLAMRILRGMATGGYRNGSRPDPAKPTGSVGTGGIEVCVRSPGPNPGTSARPQLRMSASSAGNDRNGERIATLQPCVWYLSAISPVTPSDSSLLSLLDPPTHPTPFLWWPSSVLSAWTPGEPPLNSRSNDASEGSWIAECDGGCPGPYAPT